MRKQLCSINKQEKYSKALYYKTFEQQKNFLLSQLKHYIDEGLTFQKTPGFLWGSNNVLVDKKMSQFIKITFIKLSKRCKDIRGDNLIKLDPTNFPVTVC